MGSQRSKSDLVRNFLDAVPANMRMLIMVKNPGVRTAANMAIDELFLLAKEIAAAEKMVGGAKQAVMLVEQQDGGRNHYGEIPEVFPIEVNNHNEGRASTCFNCNSPMHLSRDCDKPRRCYNCNQYGHVQHNCPAPPRTPNRDLNRRNDFNRGTDRHYPDRDRNISDGNFKPNNTLGNNAKGNWRIHLGGQVGRPGVSINMVKAG